MMASAFALERAKAVPFRLGLNAAISRDDEDNDAARCGFFPADEKIPQHQISRLAMVRTVMVNRSDLLARLYIATAHIALALAFAYTAVSPRAVTGFFYHSRMVALVHLVTIGWITFSLIGIFYLVSPKVSRALLRPKRWDYAAYALLVIGLVGLVTHFWIEEFGGMAWSALTATCGAAVIAGRISTTISQSPLAPGTKLMVRLGLANLASAACAGTLLGFDKVDHFLPGFVLANVFAHAHLAAIGWATLMSAGMAYVLLQNEPAVQLSRARNLSAAGVLLEIGLLVLIAGLVAQNVWAPIGGAVIVIAILYGLASIPEAAWMSSGSANPDFAVLHMKSAAIWLMIAASMGMVLLTTSISDRWLRLAMAYAVAGLLGFLSQLILGIELSVWPTRHGPLVHGVRLVAWQAGVTGLAAGFFFDAAPIVATAAATLFAAVILGSSR